MSQVYSGTKRQLESYGFTRKSRMLSSGRVIQYTPAVAVVGSTRYNRRYGGRYGNRPYYQTYNGLNRNGVASRETGYVDFATQNIVMDTTGGIVLIATVAQGAAVTQRIGKKILWKSMQIRGKMFAGSTAVFNDVAWLIVYDRRPTGVLPAITDILVAADPNAFNNDVNSGRFTILKRVDAMLVGSSTTPTEASAMSTDCFIDLKKRKGVFKAAATGAIGDIEEGALYLVSVGNNAAGTTAATLTFAARTRFHDV